MTDTTTIGPWRFEWEGGRLADVFHAESDTAQDCVQVGNYDGTRGKHSHRGHASLAKAAREWVAENANDYSANLS